MKRILTVFFIILFIFSCSNNNKNNKSSTASSNKKAAPSAVKNNTQDQLKEVTKGMPIPDDTQNTETNSPINENIPSDTNENNSTVSIQILPNNPYTDTDLKVNLPNDFMGDIEWKVNGEKINGITSPNLNHDYFKKGDRISFEAKDNIQKKTYQGKTTILNRAPRFLSTKKDVILTNNKLTYKIIVKDQDNDNVKIDIVQAPEGYEYDPGTQTITLPLKGIDKSTRLTFLIQAKDSEGAEATQQFTLTLNVKKSFSE